jgi:hypothetical protein
MHAYRLWELLTMGAMAVIERGVGLDRTVCVFTAANLPPCVTHIHDLQVWKLPVLLVEDFAEVTPELLRAAYVEALYRANAGHFEFQRLKQSYWYSFLMNVSTTASLQTILDAFPMAPEDRSFARPAEPYRCSTDATGVATCGPGTKRTPAQYC